MALADEFEKYDSCTADTLEVGDIIFVNDQFVEVHCTVDYTDITIMGYSYNEDSDVEIPDIDAHTRLDLFKIAG